MNRMYDGLQKVESYERMILDASLLPILQIQKGSIVYANTQAKLLFMGDQAAVLEGQLISKRISSKNSDIKVILDDCLEKLVASEPEDCIAISEDGNEFPVQLFVMPVQYNDQKFSRIIVKRLTDNHSSSLEVEASSDSKLELESPKISVDVEQAASTETADHLPLAPKVSAILKKALGYATKGKKVTLLTIRIENIAQLEHVLGGKHIQQVAADIIDTIKCVFGENVLIENHLASLFHILVGTQNISKLKQVADKLSRAMDELVIKISEKIAQIATSISVFPVGNAENVDLLLLKINGTLNRALKKGHNHWHIFNAKEELAEQACGGDSQALLRYALENNRLRLLYQPLISLSGDKEEHYSVFLRIMDPNDKEIAAVGFAGDVDRFPMALKMDRWVILESIKQLINHKKQTQKKAHMFIHLSSVSLQDKTLLPWVMMILNKTPINADSLIFQFSEKNAILYRSDAHRLLTEAQKIGLRTSLCDFGLCLKPMKVAEEFRTDYVRLDTSMTQNMENDKEQEEIVKETIRKLGNLQRKTIAVLIENPCALNAFWRTQIDYVQGFFVQRPKLDMEFDFSMDD
ncbi:MAG: EAL domain-containing protein [Endozoicomonadaceae bacterium]|nr:EAL domain-containing protein [Endozoicomonadaceae bacterium]